MSRCIDQVKYIFFPIIRLIDSTHCLRLDRDSSLPLKVHVVQDLSLHLSARQKSCHLDDPVCQCGFSVIDMRDNTKVSYFLLVYYCQFYSSKSMPCLNT